MQIKNIILVSLYREHACFQLEFAFGIEKFYNVLPLDLESIQKFYNVLPLHLGSIQKFYNFLPLGIQCKLLTAKRLVYQRYFQPQ